LGDADFIETFYDKLTSIQSLRDSYFIVASINVIVRSPSATLPRRYNRQSVLHLHQAIAFRFLQFLERHQQLSLVSPNFTPLPNQNPAQFPRSSPAPCAQVSKPACGSSSCFSSFSLVRPLQRPLLHLFTRSLQPLL
jgi:hypothetical protein